MPEELFSSQPLRIGWLGFHQEGVPALLGLKEAGVRLEAIITLEASALSRRSAAAEYDEILHDWDVDLYQISSINDPSTVDLLKQLSLDVLFVIGWSQILLPDVLATLRIGAIGAHASLLPRNRGSAPINWVLIRGESVTGNTLIWLTEGVDEGRIIDQMEIPITPYDTCETLYQQVAISNRVMIQRLLPRLQAGERHGVLQTNTDEPVLPRRRPSDGLMNWDQPAVDIYNFVRALCRPYPGAFSFLDGNRWLIQACSLLPEEFCTASSPGTIVGPVFSPVSEASGFLIGCGPGAVVVLELESSDGVVLKGHGLCDHVVNHNWTGKVWSNE